MKKQTQVQGASSRLLIGVICLAALTLIGLVVVAQYSMRNEPQNGQDEPAASVVNLKGKTACLPHKGNGPHTLECTTGLKVGESTFYALKDLDQVEGSEPVTATEATLTVTGTLVPAAKDEAYDIAGTIVVQSATVEK